MGSSGVALYRRLAPLYDVVYGGLLQPGRRRAMARLAPRRGERVLEVGVGTGIALHAYPEGTRVVAIDLSHAMLAVADARRRRQRLDHVSLCCMDGEALAFPDASFDAVYAPYVINVVPHPVRLAREMMRVCRPGGRLVLLNHFDRLGPRTSRFDRMIGGVAFALSGVNWNLGFPEFLRDTGLQPESVELVNAARVSSVVTCRV
jgi:phosphatidylethanolamine/phosphatidyl-N-methylethanolamine N-methyltransferase